MKRFSIMLTGGATIVGSIAVCAAGIPFHASDYTLGILAAAGATAGLLGSLLYQAVKPVS